MRHIKIFVVFVVVLLHVLSAGCTSSGFKYDVVETEGERLLDIHIPESTLIPYENEGLGTLYLPEFGYNYSFINAQAVFEKEIESVYSGTDSTRIEMKFSELTDGDHKWSGEIRLGNCGLYDRGFTSETLTNNARVTVVGVPKDGGRSITLQGYITIKPVPLIEIDYDREKVETPQTVSIKAKAPVDMISIEYPDREERFDYVVGDNLDTITKDNEEVYHEYEMNLSLPQPTTGCINLHLYDRYGMNYTKELYVPRDDELCIYGINRGHYALDKHDLLC